MAVEEVKAGGHVKKRNRMDKDGQEEVGRQHIRWRKDGMEGREEILHNNFFILI